MQFTIESLQGLKIGLLYKRVQKLTRFRMVKCQPAIFCGDILYICKRYQNIEDIDDKKKTQSNQFGE